MSVWDLYKQGGVVARTSLVPAGVNNDINVFARAAGQSGNNLTVAIAVAGNNTALSVAKAGNAITINSATDGGGLPTSTAAQVIAKINSDPVVGASVFAELMPGSDGTGVVAALGATALTGGSDSDPAASSIAGQSTLTPLGITVHADDEETAIRIGAPAAGRYVALDRALIKHARDVSGSGPYTRAQVTKAPGY
jgi:hypothetical protein